MSGAVMSSVVSGNTPMLLLSTMPPPLLTSPYPPLQADNTMVMMAIHFRKLVLTRIPRGVKNSPDGNADHTFNQYREYGISSLLFRAQSLATLGAHRGWIARRVLVAR